TGRDCFGLKQAFDNPRNVVPRNPDILKLPVVQTRQRGDGAAPLPTLECAAKEQRNGHPRLPARRTVSDGVRIVQSYGHDIPPIHDGQFFLQMTSAGESAGASTTLFGRSSERRKVLSELV